MIHRSVQFIALLGSFLALSASLNAGHSAGYGKGTGRVWFDDVRLESVGEAGPETMRIVAGRLTKLPVKTTLADFPDEVFRGTVQVLRDSEGTLTPEVLNSRDEPLLQVRQRFASTSSDQVDF